jgi:hypothetical protein
MTDLQRLCLYALEDMTLVELNDKYFGGGGIGWTKRLISGDAKPYEPIMSVLAIPFEQKYHDKVAEYHRITEEMKWGW